MTWNRNDLKALRRKCPHCRISLVVEGHSGSYAFSCSHCYHAETFEEIGLVECALCSKPAIKDYLCKECRL